MYPEIEPDAYRFRTRRVQHRNPLFVQAFDFVQFSRSGEQLRCDRVELPGRGIAVEDLRRLIAQANAKAAAGTLHRDRDMDLG